MKPLLRPVIAAAPSEVIDTNLKCGNLIKVTLYLKLLKISRPMVLPFNEIVQSNSSFDVKSFINILMKTIS